MMNPQKEAKEFYDRIEKSCAYISKHLGTGFDLTMVLGSGLSNLAQILENPRSLPYETIPHFPVGNIVGHQKKLIAGEYRGKKILMFSGRFHYYEHGDMKWAGLPAWISAGLGIPIYLATNVSGGIRTSLGPGKIMLIQDHINHSGFHPLISLQPWKQEPQFSDMTKAYDQELRGLVLEAAREKNVDVEEGVYIFVSGPSYETPAEIRMFAKGGADAVGMSTVPEVLVARRFGIKVAGLSMIVNHAAGMQESIDHEKALEISKSKEKDFIDLIRTWVEKL
ncbi:MAG: purine-nucleoside phosphorylase [Bdellovibrionota bacterium]